MKKKIRQVLIAFSEMKRDSHIATAGEFERSRLEADIIRGVHSIEKGLCLENPRKGFGVAKIKNLFSLAERYLSLGAEDIDCINFIVGGVSAYLAYHDGIGYQSDDITEIRSKYEDLLKKIAPNDGIYGGISTLSSDDMNFDVKEIEKLFETRHSIREFSGERVEEETIKKAISLAQRSPSACNRQGVRVYSINGEKFLKETGNALEGIGGFAESVDKFLIITGKQSVYSVDEKYQFAVSASIFAGYLTLALHTYNVASCVIQRPLVPREYWIEFRKKYKIPEDEQIVMLIGIGKYKETTKVPLSKRFDVEKVYKSLDK